MDATRRATRWLSPTYARDVAAPMPGGGGAAWLQLVEHVAYTTAVVRAAHDDGAPPDDDTHASRQLVVDVTPHGRNGWTAKTTTSTVFVELTRASAAAPWRVNGITTA